MNIRPASESDFDEAAKLMDQLGHPLSEDGGLELWLAVINDEAHDVLMAEINGVVVAMIDVVIRPHLHHGVLVATIDSVTVDRSIRGNGIGTRLVGAAIERAIDRGVELLEVTSGTARTDAHRFYERQGFIPNGIRMVRPVFP